jgi:uncharacterized membrane protein
MWGYGYICGGMVYICICIYIYIYINKYIYIYIYVKSIARICIFNSHKHTYLYRFLLKSLVRILRFQLLLLLHFLSVSATNISPYTREEIYSYGIIIYIYIYIILYYICERRQESAPPTERAGCRRHHRPWPKQPNRIKFESFSIETIISIWLIWFDKAVCSIYIYEVDV